MKLKRFNIVLLSLFLAAGGLFGKPVDKQQAVEAALAFTASWYQPVNVIADHVDLRYLPDGTIAYYLIAFKDKGWMVISADDVVQPVLAFSFENSYKEESGWNESARYLLDGYRDQIGLAIKDVTLGTNKGWEQLKVPSGKKSAGTVIEPFIPVNWNQGNGWNRFCPEDADGPGGHAYVGCVAVAMAQAMSVYQYPVRPKGAKSYIHDTYGTISVNYDKQDDYEWTGMSQTSSDDYNARLLYHCAVSVEMNFGPDGSGAYVRTASGSLKSYFGYSENTKMFDRFEDEEAWKDLLISELSERHPIIYKGEPDDGTAGHAWNIDGYGSGYFHMNFGWSGTNNGYYSLNAITPGAYDFNLNQGAIVGLRPPESGPYDLHLSALTVREGLPIGSFVAAVAVDDEDQDNQYSYSCYTFNIPDDRWEISKLFYIENDTLLTKTVLKYNNESQSPSVNIRKILIRVTDLYNNTFEKEFDIEVLENSSGSTGIHPGPVPEAVIYPNPAGDYFIIQKNNHSVSNISIYDLTGKLLFSGLNNGRVDVSFLDEGIYILVLKGKEGNRTEKLLIKR